MDTFPKDKRDGDASLTEKEIRSRKIRRGLERRVKAGLPIGPPPLGYKMGWKDGKRAVVIDEEVAHLVKEAFMLALTGEYSLRELATIMNEKGLRSKRGNPLHATGLKRILTNPFYIGMVRYAGTSDPEM